MAQLRVYQTAHGETYIVRPGSKADALAMSDDYLEFHFIGTIDFATIEHVFDSDDDAEYDRVFNDKNLHPHEAFIVERAWSVQPKKFRQANPDKKNKGIKLKGEV